MINLARVSGCLLGLFVLVLLAVFSSPHSVLSHERTIFVESKSVQCEDSKSSTQTSCRYMVRDLNGTEYTNENDPLLLKFNSGNLQSTLEEGKSYKVKTAGIPLSFLLWKENIISVNPIVANKGLQVD